MSRVEARLFEYEGACPDGAIRHGPADAAGRCPWCGTRYTDPRPAPGRYPRSDLSEAYAYAYDPDEGSKGRLEREREFRAGTVNY